MNDPTKYISSEISDIGGRASQQDFLGKVQTPLGAVFIVADGMGGRNGGATASELAVRSILDNFAKSTSTDPIKTLKNAITNANQLILDKSQEDESLAGMGTTVAILYINDSYAKSLHVGDSRVYQFRENSVAYKTRDHSKVSEMVVNGILSEEDARTHSESNVLTQALGTRQQVSIHESEILPYHKYDSFLICTDGVWNSMSESKLSSFFWLYDDHPFKINSDLTSHVKQIGLSKSTNFDNLTSINIKMMYDSKIKVKVDPADYFKRNIISILTLLSTIILFGWLLNSTKKLSTELKEVSVVTQDHKKSIDSLSTVLAITLSKINKAEKVVVPPVEVIPSSGTKVPFKQQNPKEPKVSAKGKSGSNNLQQGGVKKPAPKSEIPENLKTPSTDKNSDKDLKPGETSSQNAKPDSPKKDTVKKNR